MQVGISIEVLRGIESVCDGPGKSLLTVQILFSMALTTD